MTEPVLETRDLVVTRGGERILDDLTLAVEPGEQLLVQGRSGAGKSTLFDMLGLLDEPTSGEVLVAGTAASGLSERRKAQLRARAIGFVFQDFQLIPELTAEENARLPQSHVADSDPAWVDELFSILELADVADQYPATLSGGEKQRVAIARAVANRPAVVLADEPTGQLDPEMTELVLGLLDRVQTEAGSALVVVSHDPRVAAHFERVRTLSAGRLIAGAMGSTD